MLKDWNVGIRFVIRCAYCNMTFETDETCKSPLAAVVQVKGFGYTLERKGVMCDECRREAVRKADTRGRYQVQKFEGYEEWHFIKDDGTVAHIQIVEDGQYPSCSGCKHMWPIARLNPHTHLCPDCTEDIEFAEKRSAELNKGRNH